MKRPAFQFYPSDWRTDAALQSCSLAAQGLWMNMICIAHECEPYGHLTVNNKPMGCSQIARLVGIGAKDCDKLLRELFDAGVFSMVDETIYSRRMVSDEDLRTRRAAGGEAGKSHGIKGASHGSKGGRPPNGRGVSEPPIKPPPSSSSSSSSSSALNTDNLPPTDAGRVCGLMRQAGIADTNPGHPDLLALLAAGATDAEFAGAASGAVGKSKGFAYALGMLKGQRSEAAALRLQQGPPVVHESPRALAARLRTIENSGGLLGREPETVRVGTFHALG